MNRFYAGLLCGIVAMGLAVVAGGQPKKGGGSFTELYRVDVGGESELEVIMGVIERADESTGAKHYHPGGEFGYVFDGQVTITTEGEADRTLVAGDSFHLPPEKWHAVNTGAKGAKTVVFRILKKGQPMVVPVD